MTKPVCIKCQRFFKPDLTGVVVLEQKPFGHKVAPGTSQSALWEPYKIWRADRYKCGGCGDAIIVGFAPEPIAQDYQTERMARWLPLVEHTVNDC